MRRRFARRLYVRLRTMKGKGSENSRLVSTYNAPGGLRQDPGHTAQWAAGARTCRKWGREMRMLTLANGPDLARFNAIGAEAGGCAARMAAGVRR